MLYHAKFACFGRSNIGFSLPGHISTNQGMLDCWKEAIVCCTRNKTYLGSEAWPINLWSFRTFPDICNFFFDILGFEKTMIWMHLNQPACQGTWATLLGEAATSARNVRGLRNSLLCRPLVAGCLPSHFTRFYYKSTFDTRQCLARSVHMIAKALMGIGRASKVGVGCLIACQGNKQAICIRTD